MTNEQMIIAAEAAAEEIRNRIFNTAQRNGHSYEAMLESILESGQLTDMVNAYADNAEMCMNAAICEDEFAQMVIDAYDNGYRVED